VTSRAAPKSFGAAAATMGGIMNIFKSTAALTMATVFLASGCAQMTTVPLTRTDQGVARPAIEAGQRVAVTTQDGVKHKFQVTAVEKDALRGEHDLIAYADMKSLQVQKEGMSISKTALIIGAVVVGAAVIGGSSGGSGSGY
jgi:hypothetical protein